LPADGEENNGGSADLLHRRVARLLLHLLHRRVARLLLHLLHRRVARLLLLLVCVWVRLCKISGSAGEGRRRKSTGVKS